MRFGTVRKEIDNSRQANVPKWSVLRDYFLSEFEAGRYKPGDLLPSENQLSQSIGVARNTIRQAISELEKEGLVYRVRGSGTFVKKIDEEKAAPKKFQDTYSLIIPEIRRTLYPSLVKGLDSQARSHYHQVMICNTDYDIGKQGDIILQLVDKGMGGVVMVPPTFNATPAHHIRQLHSNGIPVVFCHRRVPNVSAPFVGWDWEKVGRLAGSAFLEKGHRDIMFIGVYQYQITEAYARGLSQVMGAFGLRLSEDRVIYGPQKTTPNGDEIKEEMIRKALRSPNRPTAVFCSDDNEAERVYWLAHEEGIRVPEDLSLIGFGDTRRETVFQKKLVSVAIDEFDVGAKAAELLEKMRTGVIPMNHDEDFMVELKIIGKDTLQTASR